VTCHRFRESRLVGSRVSDKSNARKAVTSHTHSTAGAGPCTIFCLLPSAFCLFLPFAFCLLPFFAFCLLPFAFCLFLPFAFCLLPFAFFCLLPFAFCLFLPFALCCCFLAEKRFLSYACCHMETFKAEGIVVRAIPYRNDDCILTLFTPLQGLIPLFLRGGYKSKKHAGSGALSPLSVVEIIYTRGRGELYPCQEIAVVRHHLELRKNLAVLESACRMLQMVATTQQPEKPASELYQLLLFYLSKLPDLSSPGILESSFFLKLLRYEGIFPLLSHCSICSMLLQDTWIHANEPFCLPHAPPNALHLSAEERYIVESLAYCRDFKQLSSLALSPLLSQKIMGLQPLP